MVPLRTGRVFYAVAWAVSEGSDRYGDLIEEVMCRLFGLCQRNQVLVFCNEPCRIIVRKGQQRSAYCLLVYIHMPRYHTAAMHQSLHAEKRIIEGQVDSAFVP